MTPSKMEVRWAIELFSSTFPATREAPLGAAGVPMGAFYRDQIQACPPSVAMAYRLSVAALWWMGPLVLGRFGSFRRLSLEERERCLMKLYASPVYAIRQTVTLLKVIAGTGYLGFPDVQRQFGVMHEGATGPLGNQTRGGAA